MSQYHAPSQTADQLPEDVQRLVDFEGRRTPTSTSSPRSPPAPAASAVAVVRVNPDARGASSPSGPRPRPPRRGPTAAEAAIELHTGNSEWFKRDLNLDTAQGPMRDRRRRAPPEAPGNLYLALLPYVSQPHPARARPISSHWCPHCVSPGASAEQARTERLTAAADIATAVSPCTASARSRTELSTISLRV